MDYAGLRTAIVGYHPNPAENGYSANIDRK
jgi:hypothetical protein